jgi:hypothetical protein
MSKKHKEITRGALVRLRSDDSIGVITGMLYGFGQSGVYSINWLVNHSDNQNFQQGFSFEVIG